jgi:transposase-like protein
LIVTKPRKSLQQMAAAGEQPKQIAGKPAGVCPHCGAATFVSGTQRGDSPEVKFQYVVCRCCKKSFKAKVHTKATILYEVGTDDESSSSGKPSLTLHKESA